MARDREEVRREIEDTKASLSAKLGELSERVGHAREKVDIAREKMDVRHRVQQRPLVAMGIAMAFGMVLYRVRRSWRMRRTALTLEDMKQVAQTAARYVGDASRRAAEDVGDAGGVTGGAGSVAGIQALARTWPVQRMRRAGVFDAAARAVMGGLTRTLITSLVERVRHHQRERDMEEPYAPGVGISGGPMAQPGYPEAVGAAIRGAPPPR